MLTSLLMTGTVKEFVKKGDSQLTKIKLLNLGDPK
jgi:hypothetical protein